MQEIENRLFPLKFTVTAKKSRGETNLVFTVETELKKSEVPVRIGHFVKAEHLEARAVNISRIIGEEFLRGPVWAALREALRLEE